MKSLLVDALRQARENKAEAELETAESSLALSPDDAERAPEVEPESLAEPAEIEPSAALSLQDSARLEKADMVGASNDELDIAPPSKGELALMQTTRDLDLTAEDFETDLDPEFGNELDDDPVTDAAFDEAFEMGTAAPEHPQPNAVFIEDLRPASLLERAGAWLPLLCILLSAAAVGAVPLWDYLTRGEPGLGLAPAAGMNGKIDEPGPAGPQSRFPFIDMASDAAAVAEQAPPAKISSEPAPQLAVVRANTPRPAGNTLVDAETFRSLDAAYSAWRAGEIGAASLQNILDHRTREPRPDTELELKVLLQRHPDDARLYRALAVLLERAGRWPEARAAVAQAVALGGVAE